MGQSVAVVVKPGSRPGVLRFEANRNLTGMGHEVFRSAGEAVGPRPAASIARQLFATGQIDAVHVFGNVITVDLARGFDGSGLDDVVRDMYQYWKPGMAPPSFEDLVPADAPVAAGGDAGASGASGAEAVYLAKVPAILVERSRAALARWKAAHG